MNKYTQDMTGTGDHVELPEEKPKKIYESPDGGKTLYRRKMLDYDNREKMYPNPAQLELFKDC